MCVHVCAQGYEVAKGEVSGTVVLLRLDRMLLSLFSECDLHKQVTHKRAAARTCTVHTDTYTWQGDTKVITNTDYKESQRGERKVGVRVRLLL